MNDSKITIDDNNKTPGNYNCRIGTPEFETITILKEGHDYFTDELNIMDQEAITKRESPLNDLSLPATFNEQTFEPPEHPEMKQTIPIREVHYNQIIPDPVSSSLSGVVSEELEAIVTALETQVTKAIIRLRTCTDFDFPHSMKPEEIKVHTTWEIDSQRIILMKEKLIQGFQQQTSLGDIACVIIDELEEKEGGSWMCLIKPAQAQVGLSFHSTAQLVLSFKANDIEYEVQINKTSQ